MVASADGHRAAAMLTLGTRLTAALQSTLFALLGLPNAVLLSCQQVSDTPGMQGYDLRPA
jgi:hypothetical protein